MEFPVVERLIDAINRHDLDAMVGCFAEDMTGVWPAHPARSHVGAHIERRNWAAVFERFPRISVSVTASVASGDEFWGEWHYRRPGAPDLRGVIIIKVRGDEIVQSRFYMEEVEDAVLPHPMPGVPAPSAPDAR